MIKSIELKFTSGNDVLVERAVITRDEYIQIKQQAETIELLKHGMKGDYDLDQWLDWAISKKHMMETIERLKFAISNLDSMETPSDIKGRFQSELFWRGVFAARDALNKLEAGEL